MWQNKKKGLMGASSEVTCRRCGSTDPGSQRWISSHCLYSVVISECLFSSVCPASGFFSRTIFQDMSKSEYMKYYTLEHYYFKYSTLFLPYTFYVNSIIINSQWSHFMLPQLLSPSWKHVLKHTKLLLLYDPFSGLFRK